MDNSPPSPVTDEPTPPVTARPHFLRANLATIVRDDAMDAWRLEVWDDRSLALGLWPLADFDELDDASYGSVRGLLSNVGLNDDGRDGWAKVEESWMSPLHAVE